MLGAPDASFSQSQKLLSGSQGINYSFLFYGPFLIEYGFVNTVPASLNHRE